MSPAEIDREAFDSFGSNQLFLQLRAAHYELTAITAEYEELGRIGADAEEVQQAVWRHQHNATERWYRPYLFDNRSNTK